MLLKICTYIIYKIYKYKKHYDNHGWVLIVIYDVVCHKCHTILSLWQLLLTHFSGHSFQRFVFLNVYFLCPKTIFLTLWNIPKYYHDLQQQQNLKLVLRRPLVFKVKLATFCFSPNTKTFRTHFWVISHIF